jgi:hypothetical protein
MLPSANGLSDFSEQSRPSWSATAMTTAASARALLAQFEEHARGDDCLEIISDGETAQDPPSLSTLLRSMTIRRRNMQVK